MEYKLTDAERLEVKNLQQEIDALELGMDNQRLELSRKLAPTEDELLAKRTRLLEISSGLSLGSELVFTVGNRHYKGKTAKVVGVSDHGVALRWVIVLKKKDGTYCDDRQSMYQCRDAYNILSKVNA